jgi:hypothetical protein
MRINRFDSNWLQTDLRDSNTDYAIEEVLSKAFASVLTEKW